MFSKLVRQTIKLLLTGSKGLVLHNTTPNLKNIATDNIGLYLHIPFCHSPCMYCPYFKEKYDRKKTISYKDAILKEIKFYQPLLEKKKITSFYIGGGTPTTMINNGLEEIIKKIYTTFNVECNVSTETHPNDINNHTVNVLKENGVENVSMGVETFSDKFLRIIGRPYNSKKAKEAVKTLVKNDFSCVNIDIMFGLPDQKLRDVEKDIKTAIELNVDQISAYPIFTFPHTQLKKIVKKHGYHLSGILERRAMLKKIEDLCYNAGMRRTSVWAFTKKGVKKYSSVTIPHYIGLGAGAGSLIPGYFFINVFNVAEYIKYINKHQEPPIALTIEFNEKEEMIHWLYWRIYETRIYKKDFYKLFEKDFDETFGKIFSLFKLLGMAKDKGDHIVMTDKGNYWIHVLQNLFSLDFIGRVWSVCLSKTWPKEITLV
ncbi:MAG TPA: coproporphyrinogen III oxidase family protein [Thermoplasmatales archaeon]|nr:coproporphyrinogen III oxidase family protein [Thermoplasmatales archaeon]